MAGTSGSLRSQNQPRSASGSYRWVIVVICTGVTFVVSGTKGSFGAFFKAVQEDLVWDRSTTAGVASMNTVAWALSQPIVGRLVDRYGARDTMLACLVLMVVGLIPLFWVESVWSLYIFFGLVPGFASSGASMVPAASLIGRWFKDRAGLASGVVSSAIPLGLAIFTPMAAALVVLMGWRLAYISMGATLVVVLPFIWLYLRDDPPEAVVRDRPVSGLSAPRSTPGLDGMPVRAAVRTPLFWLLLLSQTSCGIVDMVVGIHFIPFVSDQGRTEVFAAFLLGASNLVAVGGSIAAGWVCDRFGRKWALFVMHGLRVVSLPMLIAFGLHGNANWLYVFVPLYGATVIMGFPATTTLVARMFGVGSLGAIYGYLQLMHHMGMAFGTYLGGFIFDVAGNYYPAFAIAMAISSAASLGMLWIDESRPLYRRQMEV